MAMRTILSTVLVSALLLVGAMVGVLSLAASRAVVTCSREHVR
jgi:hypothetical protein